jgi:nucleoside phosphorylase
MIVVRSLLDKIRGTCKDRVLATFDEADHSIECVIVDTSAYVGTDNDAARIDDEARIDDVATLVLSCLGVLYQTEISGALRDFDRFLENPRARAGEAIESFKYPVVEIYVRVTTMGGPEAEPTPDPFRPHSFGYITEAGTYEASIARPWLFRAYLRRQIVELVRNHKPVIRVRRGIHKIPIHFAFDANDEGEVCPKIKFDPQRITPAITAILPFSFHVPRLSDIEDLTKDRPTSTIRVPSLEYINQRCFRSDSNMRPGGAISDEKILEELLVAERDERTSASEDWPTEYVVHPLSLFSALRVDYSLGRLKHYTKTSPKHFQQVVVFTNYPMYMEEFARYVGSLLLLRAVRAASWSADTPETGDSIRKCVQEFFANHRELRDVVEKSGDSVLTMPGDSISEPVSLAPNGIAERIALEDFRPRWNHQGDGGEPLLLERLRVCLQQAGEVVTRKNGARLQQPDAVDEDLTREERLERDAKREVLDTAFNRVYKRCSDKRVRTGLLGPKSPQMPAYHWERPGGRGITMINIGVGPSNAKTISDHLAVLRPHAFLMLGHCGGLRETQRLGHYVLANGYLRVDGVLDTCVKRDFVIPPIEEIDSAIRTAFEEVKALSPADKRRTRLRNGTVATVMDRNWELRYPYDDLWPFDAGKCVAVDMESGTIAANGFRYSVPYASFLCVSDKPLHGELKMEGMADQFYRNAVAEHFQIAIKAVERLCRDDDFCAYGIKTRQLRASVPFQ